MRLVSFVAAGGRAGWGVERDGGIADIGVRAGDRWPTLRAYLEAPDPDALAGLANGGGLDAALADVALAPPVPNPDKIICVGLNFEPHRIETGRPRTEHPVIFTRFADTQVGHGGALVRPRASGDFDYEGEIAIVIGRAGRAIAEADALDHVAGYAIYQDASVRDYQNHSAQFTPGKNFPATGGFGPALVTADEIPDYRALSLTTRVSGEVLQEGRLSELTFSLEQVVAYCSTWTTLRPGDVIALGTPGGIGSKRTPPRWLVPGDVVEVEVPGLGTLVNPVVAEA